jgi:hypothetical protein
VETCSSPSKTHFPTSQLSPQEKVDDWQRGLSNLTDPGPISDNSVVHEYKSNIEDYEEEEGEGKGEGEEDEVDMDFKEIILGTTAYEWFISRITRTVTLFSPESSIMDAIAQQVQTTISSHPPSRAVSKKSRLLSHCVTFEVDWDPITFIKEQCYDEDPQDAIARAITLTGTATEAQAALPAQYIGETWPFFGEFTMRLVQYVVSGKPGSSPICEFLDNERYP